MPTRAAGPTTSAPPPARPSLLCLALPGLVLLCLAGAPVSLVAASYTLERPGDSLAGALAEVVAQEEDTLPDLARANGLGLQELRLANPGVDTWLPGADTRIVLPTWYVLPAPPHVGIVLNVPEMRLYYFPTRAGGAAPEVVTHPVGIGRQGWATPYLNTRIIEKRTRPYWYPPESIRAEYAAQGDPLPKQVPPGPENPLGEYALRLGVPQYIIHGTNKPTGVGMRVSHGCIRLYPEDIESLYRQVALHTPVRVINQPYKVGRHGDTLYLEAHPYLAEDAGQFEGSLTSMVKSLIKATGADPYELDWDLARAVIGRKDGIPVEIGRVVAGY